ncbi:hypothetical protein WDZ92_04555 [Nostoc sp. NIES-2111]
MSLDTKQQAQQALANIYMHLAQQHSQLLTAKKHQTSEIENEIYKANRYAAALAEIYKSL